MSDVGCVVSSTHSEGSRPRRIPPFCVQTMEVAE
jgi:hypothetical protein